MTQDDAANGGAAGGDRPMRGLVSLRYRYERWDPTIQLDDDAAPAGAEDDASDETRVTVMLRLSAKIRKLIASEEALRTARDAADSEERYREIDLELDDARAERMLCEARKDAVESDRPFRDPGPDAETRLLDAIQRVDRALQNSAAVSELLAAVHELIGAYSARSTVKS